MVQCRESNEKTKRIHKKQAEILIGRLSKDCMKKRNRGLQAGDKSKKPVVPIGSLWYLRENWDSSLGPFTYKDPSSRPSVSGVKKLSPLQLVLVLQQDSSRTGWLKILTESSQTYILEEYWTSSLFLDDPPFVRIM